MPNHPPNRWWPGPTCAYRSAISLRLLRARERQGGICCDLIKSDFLFKANLEDGYWKNPRSSSSAKESSSSPPLAPFLLGECFLIQIARTWRLLLGFDLSQIGNFLPQTSENFRTFPKSPPHQVPQKSPSPFSRGYKCVVNHPEKKNNNLVIDFYNRIFCWSDLETGVLSNFHALDFFDRVLVSSSGVPVPSTKIQIKKKHGNPHNYNLPFR